MFQSSNQSNQPQYQQANNTQKQQQNIIDQRLTNINKNSKNIPFSLIVKFFVKISNLRGLKKANYCRQFIKIFFKQNRQPSFVYSILRLILPSDDRDRGNYGLKQKGLAKIISETLGLNKQQYQRLYHYKNPNFHKKGFSIGDFSLCVFQISKNFCKQNSELTLFELNILLDQISMSNGNHISIFRQIFEKSNSEAIKWIIRILLKDLKLGIKLQNVLNSFHKDSYDFFNLTNSLLEVCKKFQNVNISLNDEIKVFNPIRPMLAGKRNIAYFRNQNKILYLETKYDGQRIQAHWDGKDIKLFSRNAINYTHVYKQIVDILATNLQCDACILDGQIIVLQKQTLQMVPFGMNKVVALSNVASDMQLCFKVFDVLWIKVQNQQMNMMKLPLRQRKKILQTIFKPIKGKLQIVFYKIISDFDEVIKSFSESIEKNEEGIMLKDPQSLYLPKDRSAFWLKLKGDYIDGLTDSLDLLIIGGYFGDKSYRCGDSNHWTDKITTFVLGLLEKNQDEQYIIYPFCKVGTGYSGQELRLLRAKLRDNLVIDDSKFYPPKLKAWKFSIQDKPDCWIKNFQKSIILQIKAAQIIRTQNYPTNYTLRFPRVIKIRYDKNWDEGLNIHQLDDMRNNTKYKKNLKKIQQNSDSDEQKKLDIKDKTQKKLKTDNLIKQKNKNAILQNFKCVNLGQKDLKKSNLFDGLQFMVLNLIEGILNRNDMERQIILNGGKVSQNPLQTTHYIIADHIDFRVNVYKNANLRNIYFVKPKYILNCIKLQTILPIIPFYLTCLPQKNRNFFTQNFDKFSDSYTNYINMKELQQILSQISNDIVYPINDKLIQVINIRHRRKGKKSVCIGLKKIDIIKLKMNKNQIIEQLKDDINLFSIIVGDDIKQYEKRRIQEYILKNPSTIIQNKKDLQQLFIL